MNRNILKTYAPQARRDFIKAVTDRAAFYGLTQNGAETVTEHGDVAIIAGKPFPRTIVEKRRRLEGRIRQEGFEQVMEAVAYTWFNRFAAIRFMELHGYLDHGYRVLSHPMGGISPEIVEHAEHVDLPGLDRERIIGLKLEGTRESELYRMILIAQCNALHKAMPFLFEWIDDETELLLPENLLHSDSLIRKLVNEIPEEDWQEVEIIGWLYQFYISEKKDQVIGKVINSEDIPAATQLFTPNWIVRYMVQNTLGQQWIANHPNSRLKPQMEFYIEPSGMPPETLKRLTTCTGGNLNPEDLTLLDGACGSGHILVEAYNLFKAIYQERGYRAKDIPRLILERNLFGIEIDDRAAQLAAFALLMKARADDRKIFERAIKPNVLSIQESKGFTPKEITDALNAPILKAELPSRESLFEEIDEARAPLFSRATLSVRGDIEEADLSRLIELFQDGKTFGSLIRVPEELGKKLPGIAARAEDVLIHGDMFAKDVAKGIIPIVKQAQMLSRKYNAVVSNPPYMGSHGMNALLKTYARTEYASQKADLYAMFIRRMTELVSSNGSIGLMTPFTWMFLSSYESLRKWLLNEKTVLSLIHPEYHSFFESAYVPICTFVLINSRFTTKADFIRLSDFYGEELQQQKALEAIRSPGCGWRYSVFPTDFAKIPGSPIAYWTSQEMRDAIHDSSLISDYADTRQGLATGDNDRFLRYWYEVSNECFCRGARNAGEAIKSGKKWFPCNKGGPFRKWYGNNLFVVNWQEDGRELREFERSVIRNQGYYFREGLTWSSLTIGTFSMRLSPPGFIFESKGSMCFPHDSAHTLFFLGYFNTNLVNTFLRASSPTLDYHEGPVGRLPIRLQNSSKVDSLVEQAVDIARQDWDSQEISWGFLQNSLIYQKTNLSTIEESYENLKIKKLETREHLRVIEESINEVFINAFELGQELSPRVSENKITLSVPTAEEAIRELISYGVGCILGRYSLEEPGLVYANSGNIGLDPGKYKRFPVDPHGIVPITEIEWFAEDAVNRLIGLIAVGWPNESLEENLRYIAAKLGPNRSETPRDAIRRYMSVEFYKHHLSVYKKRPIYWLFRSGKQRAFQCLVYVHRYHEGTLSRMRTEYVIPLQGKFSARIEQLAGDIARATSTSHRRNLEKERTLLLKQQSELRAYDEKLRHYAELRISIDLDDGVKVNYGKFGDLLAEVKSVTGDIRD